MIVVGYGVYACLDFAPFTSSNYALGSFMQ